MISKKFIFSLGCVIFLLLTIGAVSASTVDMAGVKFNIPEGYDEFEDASINGAVDEETQFITYCKFYTGGLEDMIIIAVAYPRGDDFKFTLNDVLNDAVKDFMNRNNEPLN